jgi:cation diffusion facilitator family transporter
MKAEMGKKEKNNLHVIPKEESAEKIAVARLSIYSNVSLTVLKLLAGGISGSVSIISEAIHSGMDLIASIIAYTSVRVSGEPPDAMHAYGHGKYESISGLIESLLIIGAGLLIIYEAAKKLIQPHEIESSFLLIGIVVMGISALTNLFVSHRLMKTAKRTQSIALESDAWHLRTDIYTSAGVMAGLIAMYFTGITLFDPLIALIVASFILKTGIDLTKRSYHDLLDSSLSESERSHIEALVSQYRNLYLNAHGFKTRRAGPEIFIEFHLVVDGTMSVRDAHALIDTIEAVLQEACPRSTVTIHLESCEGGCSTCTSQCGEKKFG